MSHLGYPKDQCWDQSYSCFTLTIFKIQQNPLSVSLPMKASYIQGDLLTRRPHNFPTRPGQPCCVVWSWLMSFNITKCATLSITRKRKPSIYQYSMLGDHLNRVTEHVILGRHYLQWSSLVQAMYQSYFKKNSSHSLPPGAGHYHHVQQRSKQKPSNLLLNPN